MHNHKCLWESWKPHYRAQTYGQTATSHSQEPASYQFKVLLSWLHPFPPFCLTLNHDCAVPCGWGNQIRELDLKNRHPPPHTCKTVWVEGIKNGSLELFPELICSASPLAKWWLFYASPSVGITRKVLAQPCEFNAACGTTAGEHPVPRAIQSTSQPTSRGRWDLRLLTLQSVQRGTTAQDHPAQLTSFNWVSSSSLCLPLPKPLPRGARHHLGLTLFHWPPQEGITEWPGWGTPAALHRHPRAHALHPRVPYRSPRGVLCPTDAKCLVSWKVLFSTTHAPGCREANPGACSGGRAKQRCGELDNCKAV